MIQELAKQLAVPTSSLEQLHVGWCEERDAWTFPEQDGQGNVVGIIRRSRDGTQQATEGSQPGLYVPDGFERGLGPVLVVEGASDTVAATAIQLVAVGRPSAKGGVAHLVELLQDDAREVLVVGEMDATQDGQWPGRDGAQYVARQLAGRLRQQVSWALQPRGVKGVRAWLNQEVRDAS